MEHLFTGSTIKVTLGVVAACIVQQLGGWGAALQTLIIFMIIDYASGVAVAVFFKKSLKSEQGGFNSSVGLRGIIKKAFMLMGVWMAHQIDVIGGVDFVRTAYIVMLCVNEFGSIGENFGIMGVPMPKEAKKVFDVLQNTVTDKEA